MTSSNNISTNLEQMLPLIKEQLSSGQTVRYYPRGTSMLPMLRQEIDSVELSPVPPVLKKYDLPFYTRKNGQHVLHRIIGTADAYTCIGDNQKDPEYPVFHHQVFALVTAFYRGGKRIPVTSVSYRAYCVLWHYSRPLRHFCRRCRALAGRTLRKLGLKK